jgi:acetyl esterase/lipase
MTIAAKGFVVVNISYRLITEEAGGSFPVNVEDIFAALKWTKENIADYGGDLNNFFITGDSAGAHLTSLVLSVYADSEMQEKLKLSCDVDIKAAGLTCGVADLEYFLKIKLPIIKHLGKLFLGKNYKTSEYRSFLTIKNNKVEEFPPLFFDTCDGDFIKRDVLKFYEECTSRGVETELNYVKKRDRKNKLMHVYAILFPQYENSQNTIENMLAFFKKHMVQ